MARSGSNASIAARSSSNEARNLTTVPFSLSHAASDADISVLGQAVPTYGTSAPLSISNLATKSSLPSYPESVIFPFIGLFFSASLIDGRNIFCALATCLEGTPNASPMLESQFAVPSYPTGALPTA